MAELGEQPAREAARTPWLIPAGMALAIVLVAAASLWSVYTARRQAIDDTGAQLANLNRAFAAEALRTLAETSLLLDSLARQVEPLAFAEAGMQGAVHDLLARRSRESPLLAGAAVVDAQGIAAATSRQASEPRISVADRPYFRFHRDNAEAGVRLWPPLQNRLSGNAIIPATRRLTGPDGRFLGVIVASLGTSHFATIYDSVRLGSNVRIRLSDPDGVTIAANDASLLGTTLGGLQYRDRPFQPQRTDLDGQPRLFVIGQAGTTGYLVSIGIDLDQALANWRVRALEQVAVFTLAVLAIAALGWLAIRRDRGLRVLREHAQNQADILNSIIAAIPDPVTVFDADGRSLFANPASHALYGKPSDDPAKPWSNVRARFQSDGVTPYTAPALPSWLARGAAPRDHVEIVLALHDRPEPVHLDFSASRFAGPNGRTMGVVVIGRDVSVQRRTERELGEARKLEAIGRLTGGVAHDFNNILTVIVGSGEALQDEFPPGTAGRRTVDLLLAAAQRGAGLTRAMLAFARRQPLLPRAVDANALLASIRPLIQGSLGQQIELSCTGAADLWPCLADPGQLEVALLNLCINARDAMPQGGRLTVTTANRTVTAADRLGLAPGDYVSIAIADTGQGMTADVLARAIEPFFTTKETGKGTGLGLSMVHGFATQSGGTLHLVSVPDEGTTASLYLPRHAERPVDRAHEPVTATPRGNGERVLAVEDEPLLREQAQRQLRGLGYAVTAAATAREALDLLAGGLEIDLLFTDIVMPGGMNGVELAAEVARLHPAVRILFTSGYPGAADDPEPGLHLPAGARLLAKPYRVADLGQALRAALA